MVIPNTLQDVVIQATMKDTRDRIVHTLQSTTEKHNMVLRYYDPAWHIVGNQ